MGLRIFFGDLLVVGKGVISVRVKIAHQKVNVSDGDVVHIVVSIRFLR